MVTVPPIRTARIAARPGRLDAHRVDGQIETAGLEDVSRRVRRERAHLERQLAAVGQRLDQLGGDAQHAARIDRQQADRPSPEDHHPVACRGAGCAQGRDRRGQRFGQHRRLVGDAGGDRHERVRPHRHPSGEHTLAVETDQATRGTQIHLAAQTRGAVAAADDGKQHEPAVRAGRCAHRLMPQHQRRHTRPGVAAIGVQIGTADSGERDVERDLPDGRLRLLQILERELRSSVPYQGIHDCSAL